MSKRSTGENASLGDARFEQRRRVGEGAALERERASATRARSAASRSPAVTRLVERAAQRRLDALGLPEADRELEVREPKLARRGRIEIRAGLEIVGGDAELRREAAQRLHGRCTGTGLDARDVGVRNAGGSELTLGKTPIQPQTFEPLPDRLARGWRNIGLHLAKL